MAEKQRVTVYLMNSLMGNIQKVEARLVDHGRKPFAQYTDAVYVHFIPKGKRKVRGYTEGYKPYVLILDGWGHPDPDSMFGEVDNSGPVPVATGRYRAFDAGWTRDFEAKIDPYIARDDVTVVADYRETPPVRN